MRKSDFQQNNKRVGQLKKRVDVREWDFSKVPPQEEHACCYYEYARESSWLMEQMDSPAPKEESIRRHKLENNLLTYALPPVRRIINGYLSGRQKYFDGRPWLAQESEWRQEFCKNVEKYKDRLGHARILKKIPDRAFGVGITLPFPWQRWDKEHENRILDLDTGLEAILVTIDWGNFKNSEIIGRFDKWVKSKEGRPQGVGLKTLQGKRTDAWRKKLERLALLRLRHHYSLEEMAFLLPKVWNMKDKFTDNTEVERERKAARQTLFELFPFLPDDTEPVSWSKV
jgi:hypothetical protein